MAAILLKSSKVIDYCSQVVELAGPVPRGRTYC